MRWTIRLALPTMSIGDVTPLIWISLPCAGGTPWTYVHQHENPQCKREDFETCQRVWSAVDFIEVFFSKCWTVTFTSHWNGQEKCRYWNLTKVSKLLIQYDMVTYNFDGCALGTKDQVGIPLEEALDCGYQPFWKRKSTIQIPARLWSTACSRQRFGIEKNWRIHFRDDRWDDTCHS